ncbi:MAG TPA: efflux RND transporter periplasmic adaptor subunit [Polyangiaceae bacterium]|jgi:multidrug efflux system membrane fusion protein|nr:efflux RND transporter periplasmic adaptor subunit [Polyangiaceae bacterium]
MRLRVFAGFGICVGLTLLSCQRSPNPSREASPTPAGPPVPVSFAVVESGSLPLEIAALGRVESSSDVAITPQVSGRIEKVHFAEGDRVQKGDPLFSIDARTYRASVAEAEARLLRDRALAAQAGNEATRAANLASAGVGSNQDTDKARADASALQASVAADEAELKSARLNVEFSELRSPISGRTGSLLVHAGNLVTANANTPLVVIRCLSPAFVRFAVPAERLSELRERLATKQSVSVEARLRGDPSQPETGTLTLIENQIDTKTGMIELKARFDNADERLWPGQDVEALVRLGEQANAVSVPDAAVRPGQDGPYVYVLNEHDEAVLRPVTLDRTQEGRAVIRSGLAKGERVIVDGLVRVAPGVRVTASAAASAPPATAASVPAATSAAPAPSLQPSTTGP